MENIDRKDLKIQALLEKVSSLTTQYENQSADLRVELTVLAQNLEQANVRIAELEGNDVQSNVKENPEADDAN